MMDSATEPKKQQQDAFLVLSKRITILRQELRQKEDQVEQLQGHVLWLETEFKKKQSDSRDEMILNLKKENNELKRQLSDSPYKVDIETQTIHHLQPQKDAKADIETQTIQHLQPQKDTKVDTETQTTQLLQPPPHLQPQIDMQTGVLAEIIEEKLKAIQDNIENIIDDKLKRTDSQPQRLLENMTTQQTYANAARTRKPGATQNIGRTILQTSNEEIAEELDRNNRVNNIIIHGKKEANTSDDIAFAENLLRDLNVRTTAIKEIKRIGQQNEHLSQSIGKRPIKLVLKNKEDKEAVINNLWQLKYRTSYTGISVTSDYTQRERLQIKELQNKAKEMNNEEVDGNFIWKVRGTPSKGLYLKKFEASRILFM